MADNPRTQMWCDACRQGDDHPRHHILQADGTVQTRHMDCCREAGDCADGSCDRLLTASGEKRYHELTAWLKENA